MCDKAVDSCLLALEFVPDWFVTSRMTKKVDSAVFTNDYIVFGDLDSNFVTFFSRDICLNSITLEILVLMMIILIIVIQKLLILLDLWVGITNMNNARHLKT